MNDAKLIEFLFIVFILCCLINAITASLEKENAIHTFILWLIDSIKDAFYLTIFFVVLHYAIKYW